MSLKFWSGNLHGYCRQNDEDLVAQLERRRGNHERSSRQAGAFRGIGGTSLQSISGRASFAFDLQQGQWVHINGCRRSRPPEAFLQ
jgi:hypothetical protein